MKGNLKTTDRRAPWDGPQTLLYLSAGLGTAGPSCPQRNLKTRPAEPRTAAAEPGAGTEDAV